MTERDFCYWLQGFLELSGPGVISERQKTMIAEHLALVMRKETAANFIMTSEESKRVQEVQETAAERLLRTTRDALQHPTTRLIC